MQEELSRSRKDTSKAGKEATAALVAKHIAELDELHPALAQVCQALQERVCEEVGF